MRRGLRTLGGALGAFLALSGVFFAVWLLIPHRGPARELVVAVPKPLGAGALGLALARAGAIDHPRLFAALAWAVRAPSRVHGRALRVRGDRSPLGLLLALRDGRAGRVRVTVPEGFTRFDVARRLEERGVTEAAGFLQRCEAPEALARYGVPPGPYASLEGRLFPDTYLLPYGSTADEVLAHLLGAWQRRTAAVFRAHPEALARSGALPGARSPQEAALVLASMVERETGHGPDRPRVSAVFWNRLTDPLFPQRLLQSDPTVVYGCRVAGGGACGDRGAGAVGSVTSPTASMLADRTNPWNTYRREGLPPGPICNPGLAALTAALGPSPGGDLYFVARGDGTSAFATTLEAHHQNVQRYLRGPR
ncbi:MAG: endolytic transglycosylase MltG [Deltaproteobacteria bacterium]|nr:endolytic transglycosylase MltG [Deltaproteobacteria bacterium]